MRHTAFRELWKKIRSEAEAPKSISSVRIIDGNEFSNLIISGELEDALQIAKDLYEGTAFILKNCIDPEDASALIEKVKSWGDNSKSEYRKITGDGAENFHHEQMKVQKEVSGGYHSLEHSYYFFGWNDDDLGIFNLVDKYWSAVKVLSGNKSTDFRKNRPKDGVVDRISVIHYPEGSGYISVHSDPDKTQKTLLGCPLTTMGKDYPFGKQGFTVFDKWDNPYSLENICNPGDFICVYPTIHHMVPQVQASPEGQNSSSSGRWYAALYSVESHDVQDRAIAPAVDRKV